MHHAAARGLHRSREGERCTAVERSNAQRLSNSRLVITLSIHRRVSVSRLERVRAWRLPWSVEGRGDAGGVLHLHQGWSGALLDPVGAAEWRPGGRADQHLPAGGACRRGCVQLRRRGSCVLSEVDLPQRTAAGLCGGASSVHARLLWHGLRGWAAARRREWAGNERGNERPNS